MSIESPAKCEIRAVIRYLVWKGKAPVDVYNEVKTAYGDAAMNRSLRKTSAVRLKTVARLCMMIRGAKDLQLWRTNLWEKSKIRSATITDWLWTSFLRCFCKFPDLYTSRNHNRNPRIPQTLCKVGAKTTDGPASTRFNFCWSVSCFGTHLAESLRYPRVSVMFSWSTEIWKFAETSQKVRPKSICDRRGAQARISH